MKNDLISREAMKCYIDCGHLRPPTEKCFSEADVVLMLDRQPAVEAVHLWEHEALERRLRHLLESDYIRSFDEVNLFTHEYKRDIREADARLVTGHAEGSCVCKGPMKNRFFLGATPNWGVMVEKMPVHRYVLHVMYTTEHMALPIKYCPLCGEELDGKGGDDDARD